MTNFEHMRNRLLAKVVAVEIETKKYYKELAKLPEKFLTLEDLTKNWDALSVPVGYMRNRMMMGRLRYPPVEEQVKHKFDCVDSIRRRLEIYENTGNLEHLVDIANLACIEFVTSQHPNKHFEATDDGIHTKEKI